MRLTAVFLALICLAAPAAAGRRRSRSTFSVVEASIPQMQEALRKKRVTSRELVEQYLERIAFYNDKLHATIAVNPKALEEADQLDRERAQGKLRGPLHGIPIALKDNIQTTHMPTTGGALAFTGYVLPTKRRSRRTCAMGARLSSRKQG
jgi:Asp-tRNAAsn/Glu-tRNAGln amidotransferase A subunit and related amidases